MYSFNLLQSFSFYDQMLSIFNLSMLTLVSLAFLKSQHADAVNTYSESSTLRVMSLSD